jgi:hypothetical protein
VELPQTETQRTLSERDIEILNNAIVELQNQRIRPSIPWKRATLSWEYRKCGRQACRCKYGGRYRHGPYLVMVWKDLDSPYLNKLKKKHLGKSEDFDVDKVLDNYSYKMALIRSSGEDREFTTAKLLLIVPTNSNITRTEELKLCVLYLRPTS